MKPYFKFMLASVALLAIAAVGTQYYETLPGLVIKHPITGAVTAHINGTNGTVTAGAFVGDGSGLTASLVSLTPADSFSLTFTNPLQRQWLVATGQVIISSAGLAAANGVNLRIDNPGATNIYVVLPTGWRKLLGTTSNILAPSAIGNLKAVSFAANDTNVTSIWSSE